MKTYRQHATYPHQGESKRLAGFFWFLGAAMAIGSILLVASVRAEEPSPQAFERIDLTLRADQLPPADLVRLRARRQAINTALATKTRLLRSWDSREVLAETLQILKDHGADLGDTAIVNFVSMEFTAPASARDAIQALAFVRRISTPNKVVPAIYPDSLSDSEWGGLTPGLDFYRSREQGHRGAGITIAIVDSEWGSLDTIPTLAPDQVPDVPVSNRFKQKGQFVEGFYDGHLGNPNNMGTREHGTAMLETTYEIAPDANYLLYGIKGVVGIPAAIIDAADRGADVIEVALTTMETMSDSVAIEDGGTNRFTSAIDYATATGALVIVSAGNEAMRSYQGTFLPCDTCTPWDDEVIDDGICNDATNDTDFHTFEPDPSYQIPLLRLLEPSYDFDTGYYDVPSFEVTCMTAIEENDDIDKADYKFRIYRVSWDAPACDNDLNNPCDYPPICPTDRASETVVLAKNMGTTVSFQASFETDEEYTLAVYRSSTADPTIFPEFRLMCAPGLEFDMFDIDRDESQLNSLTDMGVVETALTVAAGDEVSVTEYSSRGPAANPNLTKPEISAPYSVQNFTAEEAYFDYGTFEGTSAATATIAGLAAVVQGKRLNDGLALLAPAALKQALVSGALGEADEPGIDLVSGYGFAQMPANIVDPNWTPGPTPTPVSCGNGVHDAATGEECDDGNNVDNDGCDSNCTLPGCGNGILNPEETCDDGNIDGTDCCSESCSLAPSGMLCRDAADECDLAESCDGQSGECPSDATLPDSDNDSLCDLIDSCPSDFDPTQSDEDGDGVGDVCDLCSGGGLALRPLVKVKKFLTPAGDDKLTYKTILLFHDPITVQPHIDGFALQILDANGESFVDLKLPAGLYNPLTRTGWVPTPDGRKFQFLTRGQLGEMQPKVILKWTPKKSNQVLVIVQGKFGAFADLPVALPLRATVSLLPADLSSTLCAEASFPGPKPAPYCRFNGKGSAVTCK